MHSTQWQVVPQALQTTEGRQQGDFICFLQHLRSSLHPLLPLTGVMRALVMDRWWMWRRRTQNSSTVIAQAAGTQCPTLQGRGQQRPAPVNSPKTWQRWIWRLQVSKVTRFSCMVAQNPVWALCHCSCCLGLVRAYWFLKLLVGWREPPTKESNNVIESRPHSRPTLY